MEEAELFGFGIFVFEGEVEGGQGGTAVLGILGVVEFVLIFLVEVDFYVRGLTVDRAHVNSGGV